MKRILLPLLLVAFLVLVGPVSAADNSHSMSFWPSNLTPTSEFTKSEDMTIIEITETIPIIIDTSEVGLTIAIASIGSVQGEGTWDLSLVFNDGTTIDGTLIRKWTTIGYIIPVHEIDTSFGGEWLNQTEILPAFPDWFPINLPHYDGPGNTLEYVFNRDTNQYLFLITGGGNYIDPPGLYPGSPAANPWVGLTIDGPGTVNVKYGAVTYDKVLEATERTEETSSSWLDLFFTIAGSTIDLIWTVFGFLTYFTLFDLPFVLFMIEALMGAVALSTTKDIFKAGEKWIGYNDRLLSGLIYIFQAIVQMINQAIGIFKP